MMINHVNELIGKTPLLKINSYMLPSDVEIYAKLENTNPGGSVKDRLGLELIEGAISAGQLKKGDTIIEPTAGNTGIGLAIAARKFDINLLVVVPEKFSIEKQQIMKALGAKVINTPSLNGIRGAIKKTEELLNRIPNSLSFQQFTNNANPEAYYHTLGPEIWNDVNGEIDIFVAGAGTGGTFMGVAKYLKEKNKEIRTIIVEPENSILKGIPGLHKTEGIGMEFLAPFMDKSYFDDIYSIKDKDAFERTCELAKNESLLVGSSSGAVMHTCLDIAMNTNKPVKIVTIFPDSGERYLSKNIYGGTNGI